MFLLVPLFVCECVVFDHSSHELEVDAKTLELATQHNFEVRAHSFDAKPEELRSPRIVRVRCLNTIEANGKPPEIFVIHY